MERETGWKKTFGAELCDAVTLRSGTGGRGHRDGRYGLVKWFPLWARAGPDGARLVTWTTRGVEDSPLFQTL